MSTSPQLQSILDLPGQKEMKAVVRSWDKAARNLARLPGGTAPVLPDLMWVARAGSGKTYLLRLLSEYLDSTGLMEFYGDVKVFEFLLEYCPPEGPLDELPRLIEDVNAAAGFRNQYRGVLALDISPWRGHYDEVYFRRILEYLSSIDETVLLVFIAENLAEEEVKPAEQLLRAYFRLKKVVLPYPTPEEFTSYFQGRLSQYGMSLNPPAEILVADSIGELMRSKYFDGFKTVNRMCQDIVFDLCVGGIPQGGVIEDSLLRPYDKDSEFVKSLSEMTRLRQVGLGGGKL